MTLTLAKTQNNICQEELKVLHDLKLTMDAQLEASEKIRDLSAVCLSYKITPSLSKTLTHLNSAAELDVGNARRNLSLFSERLKDYINGDDR
ncbi:MAG: hypothetical protein AAF720_00750 [Pseudomonadota bacterium]